MKLSATKAKKEMVHIHLIRISASLFFLIAIKLSKTDAEDVLETYFKGKYVVISKHLSQPTKLKAKRLQQKSDAKAIEETQYGNGILWESSTLSYPRKCPLCEHVLAHSLSFQRHLKHNHNAGYFTWHLRISDSHSHLLCLQGIHSPSGVPAAVLSPSALAAFHGRKDRNTLVGNTGRNTWMTACQRIIFIILFFF